MLTRRSFNTLLAAGAVSSMAPKAIKAQPGAKAKLGSGQEVQFAA